MTEPQNNQGAKPRFKIVDIRTQQVVAWASDSAELSVCLEKFPISGWYEALDTTTNHRVGLMDNKLYDRDSEAFLQ